MTALHPEILVYVAGPFSAPTRAGVEANIARAVAVGLEVAKLGFMPVIPHANTAHPEFEKIQPYPFWISGTTEMLRRCDAMVMVPDKDVLLALIGDVNWENSKITISHAAEAYIECGVVQAWCVPDEKRPGVSVCWGRCASWRESSGALRERDEAARLEIPVFDTIDDLRSWAPVSRGVAASRHTNICRCPRVGGGPPWPDETGKPCIDCGKIVAWASGLARLEEEYWNRIGGRSP